MPFEDALVETRKKPGGLPGFFTRVDTWSSALSTRYFEDDFFEDPLREAGALRAEDFAADFFSPLLAVVVEREVLAFFAPPDFDAPDFEAPDFEALFDELFLLVAGDFAIADVLSFPCEKGTGFASPAMVKKPPRGGSRLIARNCS